MDVRGVSRLLVAFVITVLFAVAVGPAQASAAVTVSTQPATGVGIQEATFHGSATGIGSGDWCSFSFASIHDSSPSNAILAAEPCGSPFAYTLTGLTPGTKYFYAAVHCNHPESDGHGGMMCTGSPGWDVADPCVTPNFANCPSFTTGIGTGTTTGVTSVQGTTATLNAIVHTGDADPSQGQISYQFEYGTDPTLSGATASGFQTVAGSGSDHAESLPLTGLAPGTTYYFRVDVDTNKEDSVGESDGSILSFKTGGFAVTGAATQVRGTTATLNGEVAAGDTALTYSWRLSTSSDTAGGILSGAGVQTISGGSVPVGGDQQVSGAVSGLATGKTYYYQVTTSDPSVHGAVVSFTTQPKDCGSGQSYAADQRLADTGIVVDGCFSGSPSDSPTMFVGSGPVDINGLSFSGPTTGTVTIDVANHKLTITGGYSIDLGTVELYRTAGQFSTPFSSVAGLRKGVQTTTSSFNLPQTTTQSRLFSLTIGGLTTVNAFSTGGASVDISALGMPVVFAPVTATATVEVDQDGTVGDVTAQLGTTTIGSLELTPGITFTYNPTTGAWDGEGDMILPLYGKGVAVSLAIENGQVTSFGASFAGAKIPLGDSGFIITGGGIDVGFTPFSFGGDIDADFGPEIAGVAAFSLKPHFSAAFNQDQTLSGLPGIEDGTVLKKVPFTIKLEADIKLLGLITLADTDFQLYGLPDAPFIALTGSLGQPLDYSCGGLGGRFGLDPSLKLTGEDFGTSFDLIGEGKASLEECGTTAKLASVQGAVSNKGMAVCGSVLGNAAGMGLTWPSKVTGVSDLSKHFSLFKGCNLGPYEQPIIFSARRASLAAAPAVRLPGGLPFAVIRVSGRGAPPTVTVSEPGGGRIRMARGHLTVARNRYLVLVDPATHATYVELTKPRAGDYRVTAQHGSAPITKIAVAHGLPAPSVRGRVRARHGRRTVSWVAVKRPGQVIVFHEVGAGGDRVLRRTSHARGHFSYQPAPASRGKRFMIADVYEGGLLQREFRIGAFKGPRVKAPGRPSHVTASRSGSGLTVSWHAASGRVDHYLVSVRTSDGRQQLAIVKHRSLSIAAVPAGPVTVTVTAVNRLGREGAPAATTTLS
jgi:hypothetical protein